MKTISFCNRALAALLLMVAVASCADEDMAQDKQTQSSNNATNTVVFETGEPSAPNESKASSFTRTSVVHTPGLGADALWSTGDKIWAKADDGNFYQSNAGSFNAAKNHGKFTFVTGGTYTASTTVVTYTGSNSTSASKVTIAATQTQSAPNDFSHAGASGDCGVATATLQPEGNYIFKLEHKATYLCLLPRTENALINDFVVQSVTVTADTDIAGDFTLSTTGLGTAPTANGSKSITLTVGNFPLAATTSPATNACYIVMAPQTTALNVTYKLHNPNTGITGTVTKNIPTKEYKSGEIYDITANLVNKDYTEEVKVYAWDAKHDYYYGQPDPHTGIMEDVSGLTYNADTKPNENWTSGMVEYAQYSCKDCPTGVQLMWYCMTNPYWDEDELWTAYGLVHKGVWRFKKWSAMVAEDGATLTTLPLSGSGTSFGTVENPQGNNYSAEMGIPEPSVNTNYFMVPGGENGTMYTAYHASTTIPTTTYGTSGVREEAPISYIQLVNGNYMWVGGLNYITRGRYSSLLRVMKFE